LPVLIAERVSEMNPVHGIHFRTSEAAYGLNTPRLGAGEEPPKAASSCGAYPAGYYPIFEISDMDFTRIKNLVKGNGEKLILVENGEPEVVVMSFSEYAKIAGADAPARHQASVPDGHATEERFDLPAREERRESEAMGEIDLTFDEWPQSKPVTRDPPIRLADVRLEDLPI